MSRPPLPKLNVSWSPYTAEERTEIQKQLPGPNGPTSYAAEFVNEVIGRYEATLAQYEPPDTIDVDIVKTLRTDCPALAFEILGRWNLALHAQRIRLTAEVERLGKQISGLEARIRYILDDMISVPDGTFLQTLAGEIRGWAQDQTGPTSGHADEVAAHLEDLAIVISKEGNQP